MLGDINPQSIKITSQAVIYPGRDHVTVLNIKRFSGRQYSAVDLSLLTRAVLVFPQTDPVIAYDTATAPAGTITWAGSDITIDLSDFSMPASVQSSYLIVYDAEHLGGQVLVDDNDSIVEFDFRNVSASGIIQPPVLELVSEAPADNVTYGRKNGAWVSIDEVVAGVTSVNGFTGTVVLTATDVGAEPTGTAAAAVAAHVALADPHTQYATDTDLSNHVASTAPHAVLTGVDRLAFDQTAAVTAGIAELAWNDVDKTLDLGLPDGVIMQLGQEFLIRGVNKSGVSLADGTAVYISGAQGNRVVFSLADATVDAADKTIGVLTQSIANNAEGFCTVVGIIRGLNTLAWAEGSELWLSAAAPGALTNVRPPAPNNAVRIGFVVRSSATVGSIFVRVQIISSVRELQDTVIINPLDGDIIEYDSATSTWINVPNTGGAGEVNTASNLGAGTGVFAGKVLADLQFKSLVAGTGVTLTPTATEITITASGGGGAVDSVNGLTGVVVLNTDHIAEDGAPVNLWFTNARASAAAPVQTVDGQTGTVSLTASYAPLSHVGDGGAAHANAIAAGAAGFMTGADKTKLDGIATGANLYVHPNHTGDVTSVADGAQTIAANAVTNAKLADMVTQTIKGRTTAATGDPEDLTAAQVRTLINVADGATANSTDASLRDRTTHTGVQAISTVTGLQTALDSKTGLPAVATFTGNKTLALTDINTYNVSQDATAQVVTLPAQATVAWTDDAEVHIEQGAAGAVTITGATGVTINGVSAGSFALAGRYAAATLKRTGSDAWTLLGMLSGLGSVGDWCTYGGTANALTLTPSGAPARASYRAGDAYRFRATTANTGAATVNVAGLGVKTLVTVTGAALPAGYIRTDVYTLITYDAVGDRFVADRQLERGSNASGEYERLADGSQTCTNTAATTPSYATNSFSNSFAVTWPATFIVAPRVASQSLSITSNDQYGITAAQGTTTGATFIIRNGAASAQTFQVSAIAIGRWY